MRGFEYASPTTKEQAVSLLGNNWADADILAGGTDLLALMKDDVVAPKRLVNIKDIQELRGITVGRDKSLRIGALVTTVNSQPGGDTTPVDFYTVVSGSQGGN